MLPAKLNTTEARPAAREIVYTKDIQVYTGKCAETARRMLRKARIQLQKNSRDHVSVTEFCSLFNYREADFRKILRMPIFYLAVITAAIIIFRDDFDLYILWLVDFLILRACFPAFDRFWRRARKFLLGFGEGIGNK
jgi:hypothetical protein